MNAETDQDSLRIRSFRKTDIAFALEQTAREGWDSTSELFETMIMHDPNGCFVAELEGYRAGMVTTTCYQASAWIGNVIVPPEFRKKAIGSALMEHAVRYLESAGIRSIRLEADPLGVNIYRRLGFQDEYESPRFRIDEYTFKSSSRVVRVSESDLAAVSEFDLQHFGDDRSRLLRLLFQNVVAAYRIPARGRLAGYLFVQPSRAGIRLGPWVAESMEVASDLLSAALSKTITTAIVALPGINHAGVELLHDHAFRETPSSLRMLRGPVAARGLMDKVYGLAGGAIG